MCISREEIEEYKNKVGVTVSDKRVAEFIEAYREEFGEEISSGEASILLLQLTELYFTIARPLPNDAPAKH